MAFPTTFSVNHDRSRSESEDGACRVFTWKIINKSSN